MARSKGLRIEWSKVHLIQFLRLICFAFLPSSISFVQISSVSHGLAKSNVILPRIKTRGALTFMSSLLQGCIDVNNIVEQNKVVVFGVQTAHKLAEPPQCYLILRSSLFASC